MLEPLRASARLLSVACCLALCAAPAAAAQSVGGPQGFVVHYPADPEVGTTVDFGGTIFDNVADQSLLSWVWDLDGSGGFTGPAGNGSSASAALAFADPGEHPIAMRMTDPSGSSTVTDTVVSHVGNWPPDVSVTSSRGPKVRTGRPTDFSAWAADDGPMAGSIFFAPYANVSYSWTVDGVPYTGGAAPSFNGAGITVTFTQPGPHAVEVTATDPQGASASASTTVTAFDANQPPDLDLSVTPNDHPRRGQTVTVEARFADDATGPSFGFGLRASVDGGPQTSAFPLYTLTADQPHTVTMSLTDGDGATTSRTVTITPHDGNTGPEGEVGAAADHVRPLQTATLFAQVTDDTQQPMTYAWDLDGDGVFGDPLGRTGWGAAGGVAEKAWPADGTYPVALRVTDADGLSQTFTRTIVVGTGIAVPRPQPAPESPQPAPETPAPERPAAAAALVSPVAPSSISPTPPAGRRVLELNGMLLLQPERPGIDLRGRALSLGSIFAQSDVAVDVVFSLEPGTTRARSAKARRSGRAIRLGAASLRLRAGSAMPLRARLSKRGRAALVHSKRARVTVALAVRDARTGRVSRMTRRFTLAVTRRR